MADTRRPPVPTLHASAAPVPCDDERPRVAAACDGGAGPAAPPDPSPRPNGSRLTASRSTRPTLLNAHVFENVEKQFFRQVRSFAFVILYGILHHNYLLVI